MNCLIYVHTTSGRGALTDELATLLRVDDRGPVPWAFETAGCYVSVRRNELAEASASLRFPDGFLNFPIYVEVSSDDETEAVDADAAEPIGRILQHFWSAGVPAVAECGFDELLPRNGGYRRTDVPWPASPERSR